MAETISSSSTTKKNAVPYALIVQWSDEDQCYVGSAPELFYGGCHGDDPRQVFDELVEIAEEVIAGMKAGGEMLPVPIADLIERIEDMREKKEQADQQPAE